MQSKNSINMANPDEYLWRLADKSAYDELICGTIVKARQGCGKRQANK